MAGGRLVASVLYGVDPNNPLILACVGLALLGVAALASLIPAWRAARQNPLVTLREE